MKPKLKRISPEEFLWERYNNCGCWHMDDMLDEATDIGYCDAGRLRVRPRSGEYALMIESYYCEKCWFHITENQLNMIRSRFGEE